MIKLLATLLSLQLVLPVFHKENNTIPWSASRRLTWDDFESAPDRHSGNAALTSSTISFKYSYDPEKGFNYSISCLFEKNSSWGRVKTDYILAHEQGHFDIAEIYARKLNRRIQAWQFNAATAQKEIPAMYQQIMKELADAQNEYDSGTDFSRDRDGQGAWLARIRKDLGSLQPYAAYWAVNR